MADFVTERGRPLRNLVDDEKARACLQQLLQLVWRDTGLPEDVGLRPESERVAA